MQATTAPPPPPRSTPGPVSRPTRRPRRTWHGFTTGQLVVMALASIAPVVIAVVLAAGAAGAMPGDTVVEIALGAGENPGMITFGAMFLASPMQWLTGRTQVRVRKYLGIVFFLLALSNGAMFAVESGVAAALGAPFLIAGTIALVAATPLFLTSGRWAQRVMGMGRWRALHRLTYVVAAALVAHVVLIGDIGPGFVLIVMGAAARIPAVRRRLVARGRR